MTNASQPWLERIKQALLIEPQTKEQFIELIQHAKDRDLIDADALTMIQGVIAVSEKHVRDVMVPRPQMISIPGHYTTETTLPIVTQSGHSRFPVIDTSTNKIIGILLAKDLLKTIVDPTKKNTLIQRLARPAKFVPESKPLDVLLKEFREKRSHMAIVIDEYGQTSGLITIEDVLEEIVGEIDDEYDTENNDNYIEPLDEKTYRVRALIPIADFNLYFNTSFSSEEYETIGGLLLQEFNHVPKRGEYICFDNLTFTVTSANNRLIKELTVSKI